MKFFLLTCILFGITATGVSQKLCETEAYVKQHFNPRETGMELGHRVPPRDTIPNEIITIPVVVHILFNSSDQNISQARILSQLDVLNKDFRMANTDRSLVPAAFQARAADSRIMFCLAKVDPTGRPTSGINRKYTSKAYFMADDGMKSESTGGVAAWDSEQYLNIWVCRIFGRTLGYATPPGGDPLVDGVVITFDVFGSVAPVKAGFDKGRTTTHEVAHWLGLSHIWGDELCGDDGVFDTPSQKSYNYGCPAFPKMSTCSPDGNGDMYMNFMDLTDDACMNMFTVGQKNKMRGNFALNGSRNYILRSYQCDSSLATGAPLPQDSLPLVLDPALISVFPNPAHDFVTISSNQPASLKNKLAQVYSVQGRLVFQQLLQSQSEQVQVQHLAPGIYILRIGDAVSGRSFKLVKM